MIDFTDQMELAFQFVHLAEQIRVMSGFQHGYFQTDGGSYWQITMATVTLLPSYRLYLQCKMTEDVATDSKSITNFLSK